MTAPTTTPTTDPRLFHEAVVREGYLAQCNDPGGLLAAHRRRHDGWDSARLVFQLYRQMARARGEDVLPIRPFVRALARLGWTIKRVPKIQKAWNVRPPSPLESATERLRVSARPMAAGTPETVSPAPLNLDDLDHVIEPRHVGLAFGLTASAAYFGNDVIARGDRPQLVEALRTAVEAFVTIGQGPQGLAHDPCPPTDGLWFTFDAARGAWRLTSPAGVRFIGSGLDLLTVVRGL
jgi:hypothetical protein